MLPEDFLGRCLEVRHLKKGDPKPYGGVYDKDIFTVTGHSHGGSVGRNYHYCGDTKELLEKAVSDYVNTMKTWVEVGLRTMDRVAKGDPNVCIIDGYVYTVGDESSKSTFRGFAGREFFIEFTDGRKVRTTNLWAGGTVSPVFRKYLPDNAKFANGEHWVDVGGTKCMAGGK